MHRRFILGAALAAYALPASAQTQQPAPQQERGPPPPITPENELERVFLQALSNESRRPAFRRLFLTSQVALATTVAGANAPPREIVFSPQLTTCAVFTSASRLRSVLGDDAPHRMMTGRQALTLATGKNVVINMMLTPMVTLEAADVANFLQY